MPAYSYYPGCSLHGTAKEYDHSVRLVAGKLGVQLHEIVNWNCCGATAAHSTDDLLGLALPARNLMLAAQFDRPVLAPCAMCFNRMKVAQHELVDPGKRAAVGKLLGTTDGMQVSSEVLSLLQAFAGAEMLEAIGGAVVRPLKGLKVVCYYGCLLVRPPAVVAPDDAENPQAMDRLMARLGAQVIDWGFKTECCGASLALARSDVVLNLCQRLLNMARRVGADCIVTACPMCHSNLDTRQSQIRARLGDDIVMPILYATELMGLALGYSARELWIDKHLTDAAPLCRRIEG